MIKLNRIVSVGYEKKEMKRLITWQANAAKLKKKSYYEEVLFLFDLLLLFIFHLPSLFCSPICLSMW